MNRFKKDIVREIALTNNIPRYLVEQLVDYQFKFVRKVMSKGEFESVRLHYFGLFGVNPHRIKYRFEEIKHNQEIKGTGKKHGQNTTPNEDGSLYGSGQAGKTEDNKEEHTDTTHV